MTQIYKSVEGRRLVEDLYRRMLGRWPVPFDELRIPTREGETFVVASGPATAPPLVLFHGSGTNATAWLRDIALWSRDFRTYAVDLIGEPGFSAPSRPPLTSDRYARWLDDVWSGLGLTSANIVGQSLGGWLALDYAVRRPEHVSALTAISPSGVGRQKAGSMLTIALLRMLGPAGMRRSLQFVVGRPVPRPVADALITVFRHFRPRMSRVPVLTDEQLKSLRMPVHVVVGGKDVLLASSETRDRIARCVPQAIVSYLEQEGHVLSPQTERIAHFMTGCIAA